MAHTWGIAWPQPFSKCFTHINSFLNCFFFFIWLHQVLVAACRMDSLHCSRRILIAAACCVLRYFSRVQPFATQWPIACQAPLSTGFSRKE